MIGVASISHGKDSLAMLEAIKLLGLPLDRIITADIWATDTIRGELPPMVEFKEKADAYILNRYGIKVEHFRSKYTYNDVFYHEVTTKKALERMEKYKDIRVSKIQGENKRYSIYGFPTVMGAWCNSQLKMEAIRTAQKSCGDCVQYIGIAADETERVERHKNKAGVRMPLVEIGWNESDCYKFCEDNGILAPTYTSSFRDGCWFCHNQGVGQLRYLRANYPELWALLLEWDSDSPVTFHADGRTVHDFDKRFKMEDDGLINKGDIWRWSYLDNPPPMQLDMFGGSVIWKP